jgi:phosphotransacetylase
MFSSFEELTQTVRRTEKKTALAVVEAQDEHTIESVVKAANDNLINPLLIGNEDGIKKLLAGLGAKSENFNIVSANGPEDSLRVAVKLINDGKATAIMKGKLDTSVFMKAILNKENNLVKGNRLSVLGFFQTPKYHKLFAVSDVGLNTFPDLAGKKDILNNAVSVMHAMGVVTPKVAVISFVEKVNPKAQDTVDADALKRMNRDGEIKGCIVEGPISLDLATSKESARIKGYESPVAGDADILLVPDINSGNVLAKSLTGFAGATTAGQVVGARIPVVLTSRSAEASDKFYSIVVAADTAASV